MIIEKASGTGLLDYLNSHIFKPLGIDAIDLDLAIGKGFPTGYHRFALGPVRAAPPAAHGWLWAAGELAMSASDLAKWDIARINRSLMPADDWAVQETAIKLADGRSSNYGLGVQLSEQNGIKTVSHGGEAVGFLTDNTVIPSEKFAVVVAVNADFADAQSTISRKIRDMFVPKLAPPASDAVETARTELARQVYAGLQKGQIDRKRFTANGNYYFTAQAVADYRTSLAPLGKPISFEPIRGPRLRGGFVNRNYSIVYAGQKLIAVTYADPGKDGKIEQFMVMPAD
jgi:CubicO group peptidase (beta-lactamase class C family)